MKARARIAWNLRRVRAANDLSQEDLAGQAEVDRTYVSGVERETINPSVELLERMADAMKVDISEFFALPSEGEERPKSLRAGRKPKG